MSERYDQHDLNPSSEQKEKDFNKARLAVEEARITELKVYIKSLQKEIDKLNDLQRTEPEDADKALHRKHVQEEHDKLEEYQLELRETEERVGLLTEKIMNEDTKAMLGANFN